MEVAPCVQKAGSHAASLLASLNLQRERAQFCDCVVRQRQDPDQLYPAHRCVLAAASPVLASILSSAGALVELQAPCLSDSVLALVLDYIYTGALPYTHSQQQYCNLLTAACYLQMDDLQETLRIEGNPADNTNSSSEAENQYWDEIETHRSNGANYCSKEKLSLLSNVSTSCTVPDSTGSSVSKGDSRQVTSQGLIQSMPCIAGVHRVSGLDNEVQKDQFHSAGTVKPESWQGSTEEELVRTAENRSSLYLLRSAGVQEEELSRTERTRRLCLTVKSKTEEKQTNRNEEDKVHRSPLLHLSTSHFKDNVSRSQSSSSPPPCCGAVPVIRHSSTAAIAVVTTGPPYHPVSQPSVSSSSAPDSRPGSTDNNRMVEGITTEHKKHYGAHNQDNRNNNDHIGTQSWDFKDNSDQCSIPDVCYKSNAGQSGILKQDYNSSNTDHDVHMDGLFHITDDTDYHAHCDSIQNHTKHLRGDSLPQNRDGSSFTRGFKHKTDVSFDDFPSKHRQLDCSDCCNISMTTAAEEQSIHSQDPPPAQALGTGSDSHYDDLCPEGEVKEEHSYSSRCRAEMDRQDIHCNCYGPQNDWCPSLHRAKTSAKDAASTQYEHDHKDRTMDDVTRCTSLEHENISGTKVSEPHFQSYHGHLHYHCLPQKGIHLSHGDSDPKPHPSHPDHSEQSSGEEEAGTFASAGLSPLRQHFATTDQVLLLDISAKPAELLVSYRHVSDEGEKWVAFSQKDTSLNGLGDNDREQKHETTSVAGVDKRKISARTKFGAESFDGTGTKPWVGERSVEERKSVGQEQSMPMARVIHETGVVEGENHSPTLTICSASSVPVSVQGPVSSTLSVCIPSSPSASMPGNISAHLSAPAHHPFQCSLCDRSFSQRGSLNRHVRSHLGVRPFPCPRCPMTFSRQYRVIEHMRVHQRCVLGSDFQKPPASSV